MTQKIISLLLLSLAFVTGAFADNQFQNLIPTRESLVTADRFRGDKHGQFKDDFVAVLSDGSAWKIHPTEQTKFSNWAVNDVIHVAVRTSFYWFKREHKFELVNHTRNERLKVMLVQYPRTPLTVVLAETVLVGYSYVPHTTYINGTPITTYSHVPNYEKKVALNDGSMWKIDGKYSSFSLGNRVYLGVNLINDRFSYFLITGLEREAVYTWATKIN